MHNVMPVYPFTRLPGYPFTRIPEALASSFRTLHRIGGDDPRQTSATLPQQGSFERQRGANSRIRIDVILCVAAPLVAGGLAAAA